MNKTSTKATLFFSLSSFPAVVQNRIKNAFKNRINSKNEVVINSDVHRSQAQNHEECYDKFDSLVREACVVQVEASIETKKRVSGLIKSFDARRLKQKTIASSKKSFRRGDDR